MCRIHHPFGDGDVGRKIFVAGVNHHRTVKAALNAIVTGFFIAMIQMNREYGFREDLVRCSYHRLEHTLVGVRTRSLADLNDKGCFTLQVAAKQPHCLFEIIDVVGANGIFTIGCCEQLFGRNDHFVLLDDKDNSLFNSGTSERP